MPKYRSEGVKQKADQAKQRARDIIAMPPGPAQERFDLATELSEVNLIGYARKVLEKADLDTASPELRSSVLRQLAVLTAKDKELPLDTRLNKAEAMLKELLGETPATQVAVRQDIYGSLGGVFKQRWYAFGLVSDLRLSLNNYEEGYKLGVNPTYGAYVAVNAAFVLDLLNQNAQPGIEVVAEGGRESPQSIRQKVIAVLAPEVAGHPPAGLYTILGTLTEAYLGTGDLKSAESSATAAALAPHHPWETESTVRQLAQLVRIRAQKRGVAADDLDQSSEWLAVKPLLGKSAVGAGSFLHGKVGLALSGGGFRASLYHIGVFAKLAEFDMLRHVEVISSVSGGSIVAAYYYLKLKKLLELKADTDITRADYVTLVAEMERDFLAGIQKNLRTRMLLSSSSNLKVLYSRLSSTTHRLADLYDGVLYSPLKGPKNINDLLIAPAGEADNFYPLYDNWGRAAKVPILILNSTALNTCHNWQFTASYMGEPPLRAVDAEIDSNDRFRRMYYDSAPEEYQKFPLANAVAASACVPGLFDPLLLDRLYEDPETKDTYDVELVDGGVFDNQGVTSLLDQDCSVLLVSDACGQTGIEEAPDTSHFGSMSRSNNILMARVREAQYLLLASLKNAHLLRGIMYVHLKKGLEARPIDWLGCDDPSQPPDNSPKTTYGVRRDVQKALADIRTDLDSFSDVEADSLMYSGYRMTDQEFRACISGFNTDGPQEDWRFLAIGPIAGATSITKDLTKLRKALAIAHNQGGKALEVLLGKRWALWLSLPALAILVWIGLKFSGWYPYPPVRLVAWIVGAAVVVKIIEFGLAKLLRYHNSVLQVLASLVLALVGWLVVGIYVLVFDPIYLRYGPKYRRPQQPPPPAQKAASAGG